MRISTNLDYAGDFQATAARAVALEAEGVDCVWVAEAYGFDAISMLGYLAAKTSRVRLGTGIINVFSRTPALIAQTAAGLDRLTEGRFELGLGRAWGRARDPDRGVALVHGTVGLHARRVLGHAQPAPQAGLAGVARLGIYFHLGLYLWLLDGPILPPLGYAFGKADGESIPVY